MKTYYLSCYAQTDSGKRSADEMERGSLGECRKAAKAATKGFLNGTLLLDGEKISSISFEINDSNGKTVDAF